MSCLIKNIPSNAQISSGNSGTGFPFSIPVAQCALAPDFYLILEESTLVEEYPLFTHHPRFIEVFEEDIA
jgi:hypothetical protein